jgi:hypothetical protein
MNVSVESEAPELLQGYSGCPIRLRAASDDPCEAGVTYVVEKTSSDHEYNERLSKQFDKLEAYSKAMASHEEMKCPRVLFRRTDSNELLVVGMSFEPHSNFLEFMSRCLVVDIQSLSNVLLEFLRQSVRDSPLTEVSGSVLGGKLERFLLDAQRNTTLSSCIDKVEYMFRELIQFAKSQPTHLMPIGRCHGDLTLANMLLQMDKKSGRRRIILIDFQDSYIESPLADMAKLCQDLVYGWTLRFLPPDMRIDRTRVYIAMDYIRRAMLDEFSSEPWFVSYFQFFFAINQLRVLRYSKNRDDMAYLLRSCVQEFNAWVTQRGQPEKSVQCG